MRKDISSISVASYTLQSSPYTGEGSEEPEEAGVIGIALCWIYPIDRIEAKKEFNVLCNVSWASETGTGKCVRPCCMSKSRTYLQGKSPGTLLGRGPRRIVATANTLANSCTQSSNGTLTREYSSQDLLRW